MSKTTCSQYRTVQHVNVNVRKMATATAAHNFTWNRQYNNELLRDFKLFDSNIKPARTIRPNGSFPSLTRSLSFGSPTFPRRNPSPFTRKSKSVHFADSKGLDLVSVLTFNEESELREHFSKLANLSTQTTAGRCRLNRGQYLRRFEKSNERDRAVKKPSERIIRQLAWQKICVEKTELSKCGIRGDVYVANLAFEKQVKARFTFDSWQTQKEINGEFHSTCTEDIDKFVFEIPIPKEYEVKNFKVEFAVSYTVFGDTFWDNNNGFNYHVLFASHK